MAVSQQKAVHPGDDVDRAYRRRRLVEFVGCRLGWGWGRGVWVGRWWWRRRGRSGYVGDAEERAFEAGDFDCF